MFTFLWTRKNSKNLISANLYVFFVAKLLDVLNFFSYSSKVFLTKVCISDIELSLELLKDRVNLNTKMIYLGSLFHSFYQMGRKERRAREEKRENYASQRSNEKKRNMLIAIGVFAVVAMIVGYAVYLFMNMSTTAPGGPENAGPLGSEHSHAAILVKIFGDKFPFTSPAFQIKSSWIHFEGGDGSTIHKHATGVTLGFLFDSLKIGLDEKCFVFPDGKSFCTNEEYSLKMYINGDKVEDIRDYEPMDSDRILIVYGAETPEELEGLLLEIQHQEIIK